MSKVCCICGKELSESEALKGEKVYDNDLFIQVIRKVKGYLGKLKNNELYVCADDLKTYKDKRKKYLRMLYIMGIIFGLLFLTAFVFPLFLGGGISIASLLYFILLFVFVVLFIVLVSYVPPLQSERDKSERSKKDESSEGNLSKGEDKKDKEHDSKPDSQLVEYQVASGSMESMDSGKGGDVFYTVGLDYSVPSDQTDEENHSIKSTKGTRSKSKRKSISKTSKRRSKKTIGKKRSRGKKKPRRSRRK